MIEDTEDRLDASKRRLTCADAEGLNTKHQASRGSEIGVAIDRSQNPEIGRRVVSTLAVSMGNFLAIFRHRLFQGPGTLLSVGVSEVARAWAAR